MLNTEIVGKAFLPTLRLRLNLIVSISEKYLSFSLPAIVACHALW